MGTLVVTAKGQVTPAQGLLEHLGVRPGGKVTVSKLPNGRVEIKAACSDGQNFRCFRVLENEAKGQARFR